MLGFPEHLLLLFCFPLFVRVKDHCRVSFIFLSFSVGNSVTAILSDIISTSAALSCGADEKHVCWRRTWTARPCEEPNAPSCT